MHPQDSYLLAILIEHQWLTGEEALHFCKGIDDQRDASVSESALYNRLLKDPRFCESDLLALIAEIEGIESVSDEKLPAVDDAEQLRSVITADQAKDYAVAPVTCDEESLTLLSCYPCEFEELEVLAHLLDRDVKVLLVSDASRNRIFEQVYQMPFESGVGHDSTAPSVHAISMFDSMEGLGSEGDLTLPIAEVDHGNVSNYVDWVVAESIRRRASDIHFEPMEKEFRIRCRVDGVLQWLDRPAKAMQSSVLSRLKLISHLDIAEKRLPQDGRFHIELNGKGYDFRVSTVPSTHGEGIVIRILDKERLNIGLSELGMSEALQRKFKKTISQPDGIFLVTGPTGSGKSTTLYAALNHINDPSVKILTVEDPVEYHIEGINQVQVRSEVNMTFSVALRSMLRQAPNIIMVGEIRDKETAEIAINASLTGHMVFSTLHTNDAPSAVTRLIDMGAKPFLVSAALRAVMAQRLVRYIPEKHRVPYQIAEWQLKALGPNYAFLRGNQFYRAGSSLQEYCGRIGIFEMFEVDDALRDVIYRNPTLSCIRNHLEQNDFKNMRFDGVQKALSGATTIEEVISVTPVDESHLI